MIDVNDRYKDKSFIEWQLKEDWKIDAWDKDGKLIIKDGEPISKKAA